MLRNIYERSLLKQVAAFYIFLVLIVVLVTQVS